MVGGMVEIKGDSTVDRKEESTYKPPYDRHQYIIYMVQYFYLILFPF